MTRRSFLRNLGLAAAALGVPVAVAREPSFRGRFVVDPYPPRFVYIDGYGYVRIEPEVEVETAFGTHREVNPNYVDAPYEELTGRFVPQPR